MTVQERIEALSTEELRLYLRRAVRMTAVAERRAKHWKTRAHEAIDLADEAIALVKH
jgi:hypothetical protein